MDLTDIIKEEDSWFLAQRLDRLYIALLGEHGSLRIGRQAITWGNGFVFNPMDLFNPFPPTAIDRDYKVGDDMINAQYSLKQFGDLQLLYVARRNPDNDEVEFDQASLAGKLHFALGTNEFDVLAAKHFEDHVIGAGSRGYLGNTAWRLDTTWTFLDDGDDYLSLVANMDYSWVWFKKNFYGFVEYYYNGLGKNDYANMVRHPIRFLRATLPWGWARRSAIILVMQPVDSYMKLRMKNKPWGRTLDSELEEGQSVPTYMPLANELTARLAKKMNGTPQSLVLEVLGNTSSTAHILGGATMARKPAEGVCDARGRVFGYDDMYVADGSIVPANLGVNPFLLEAVIAFIEGKL